MPRRNKERQPTAFSRYRLLKFFHPARVFSCHPLSFSLLSALCGLDSLSFLRLLPLLLPSRIARLPKLRSLSWVLLRYRASSVPPEPFPMKSSKVLPAVTWAVKRYVKCSLYALNQ